MCNPVTVETLVTHKASAKIQLQHRLRVQGRRNNTTQHKQPPQNFSCQRTKVAAPQPPATLRPACKWSLSGHHYCKGRNKTSLVAHNCTTNQQVPRETCLPVVAGAAVVAVAGNFHTLDMLRRRTWQDLEGAEHSHMDRILGDTHNSHHHSIGSALAEAGTEIQRRGCELKQQVKNTQIR